MNRSRSGSKARMRRRNGERSKGEPLSWTSRAIRVRRWRPNRDRRELRCLVLGRSCSGNLNAPLACANQSGTRERPEKRGEKPRTNAQRWVHHRGWRESRNKVTGLFTIYARRQRSTATRQVEQTDMTVKPCIQDQKQLKQQQHIQVLTRARKRTPTVEFQSRKIVQRREAVGPIVNQRVNHIQSRGPVEAKSTLK